MQQHAPEALDLAAKPPRPARSTVSMTPATADFGRRCLLARRLLERGVRFVQVWSGAGGPTQQLGQPHRHHQGTAADREVGRSARRGTAAGPARSRHAQRHAGRLEHRVRPAAVHAGRDRPRSQPGHVGRVARRGGREGAALPTARATRGAGARARARRTATTCTPRSCT